MTAEQVGQQLAQIATAGDDFLHRSLDLVESWEQGGVSVEAVEPILRFMEEHPDIDYGVPGSLVHFVERFHKKGYERRLVESISRKPTCHTVWMLNRLINGSEGDELVRYVELMESVKQHPLADPEIVEQVDDFLKNED
jgi:hypothetical protein